MNELHILSVDRADCIVMLLDTPQGRKSVVMGAGGFFQLLVRCL